MTFRRPQNKSNIKERAKLQDLVKELSIPRVPVTQYQALIDKMNEAIGELGIAFEQAINESKDNALVKVLDSEVAVSREEGFTEGLETGAELVKTIFAKHFALSNEEDLQNV